MIPGDALAQRQAFYSCLAGVIFGAGWWVLIDGASRLLALAAPPVRTLPFRLPSTPAPLTTLAPLATPAHLWPRL